MTFDFDLTRARVLEWQQLSGIARSFVHRTFCGVGTSVNLQSLFLDGFQLELDKETRWAQGDLSFTLPNIGRE